MYKSLAGFRRRWGVDISEDKETRWWQLAFFWFPYIYVAFYVTGGRGIHKFRYVEITTGLSKKGWYFNWDS